MKPGLLALALMALAVSGCSVDSAKKHYILAEKLWNEGKYSASVTEFEKVTAKDPHGKLGLQALFRAAMTDTLFLSQYGDAVRKFRAYADASPPESQETWEALRQIGEILFTKTEQYDQAIQHYRQLIKLRPGSPEVPEYLFRIGKSLFYLWQFDEAIRTYREVIAKYPNSIWAEQAAFEIGVTSYTRGEQHPGGKGPGMDAYQDAIAAYEKFLKDYPQSRFVPQAKFGIANCLEELDQLDAAFRAYEELRTTYPSRNVIEIRLARLRERKAQRNR